MFISKKSIDFSIHECRDRCADSSVCSSPRHCRVGSSVELPTSLVRHWEEQPMSPVPRLAVWQTLQEAHSVAPRM